MVTTVREADPRVRGEPDPPDPVAAQCRPGRLDLSTAADGFDWPPQWSLTVGVRAVVAELTSGRR
ncbi:MAG: hypothetical protein EKK42_08145 [Pseudonocardiaceae bacterium]|nr:MAG: hypothetical protein EKK42_08145 [Pseudonocardiaceae bacterium]